MNTIKNISTPIQKSDVEENSQKDLNSNYILWIAVNIIMAIVFIGGFKMLSDNGFSDSTGISYVIIVIFGLFYALNFYNTNYYRLELGKMKKLSFPQFDFVKDDIKIGDAGLFHDHVKNLLKIYQNNNNVNVSQETSLEIIGNKILRKEYIVQLGSNLMVTLGLIGTITGLIIAISGLENVMTSLEENGNNLVFGLKQALSGMGSAFYTTLFGAILGGFFLKLLHQASNNMADEIIDEVALNTELYILPYLMKTPEQMVDNHLSDIENLMIATRELMDKETQKISEYLGSLQEMNGNILLFNQRLENIEPQMNGVHLTVLKDIHLTLNEIKMSNRPLLKKLFG